MYMYYTPNVISFLMLPCYYYSRCLLALLVYLMTLRSLFAFTQMKQLKDIRCNQQVSHTHQLINNSFKKPQLANPVGHVLRSATGSSSLGEGDEGGDKEDVPVPVPPGHEECSYCGSVMPQLRLLMHERHCAQSTFKCPICK